MRRIKLSNGLFTLIDNEDFVIVKNFHWHAKKHHGNWYAMTNLKINKTWKPRSMHRLIMGFPKECVDHINGDGLDNRRTNLRCCTNQQNQFNQKPRRGKGAAKGTFFVKEMNRWRAYIYKDYKKINLGYFDTEEDAGKAYDAASVKLHGEFGRRNGY